MKISFFFLFFCCFHTIFAQKTAALPDFSGHWTGILRQDAGGLASEYVFAVTLTQDKNGKLSGSSKIELNLEGEYGVITLQGTAHATSVEIVEEEVIEKKIRADSYWCIKSYLLFFDSKQQALTGKWSAGASCQGTMVLRREIVPPPAKKKKRVVPTPPITKKNTEKEPATITQNNQESVSNNTEELPENYLNLQQMQQALQNKEELKGKKMILENIYFQQSTSILLPTSHQSLQKIADLLQKNSALHIKISGHTDNVGNETRNLHLSKLRAATVMNYLINKGIAEKRLVAEGNGSLFPIKPNDSETNKQQNRRVEFEILAN